MKEKEGKKLGIWGVEVGHDRATTGTGRAKVLVFWVLAWQVRHGLCQAFGILGSNFFSPFS